MCLQGVTPCETVLLNQRDWRYRSATLIGCAHVSTDDQDTWRDTPRPRQAYNTRMPQSDLSTRHLERDFQEEALLIPLKPLDTRVLKQVSLVMFASVIIV